jgi:CDP-glucose 4,6-dehydratase
MEGLVIRVSSRGAGPFGGVFRGRKVLLTGHTGFKGSWLALWLTDLGAEVSGYSLEPPTDPNMFGDLSLRDRLHRHDIGDVRDSAAFAAAMAEAAPDVVFHLAAQPLVRASYDEPHITFETNVMGTVNLFEAARVTPSVRAVVNITSDKCYENREWVYAYREIDPMGGYDPYSSSKGCAEIVTSAYRRSFFAQDGGVAVSSVRAGNVIGGGDWAPDRLVPDCVRALSAGKPILVRQPEAVRPWQHVLEPLSGYLWLAALMLVSGHEFDGGWNFGPEIHSTVRAQHIAERFVSSWGEGSWHGPESDEAQPHEAGLLKLDCTKAKSLLEWHPIWGIDKAIDATAEWYRAQVRGQGDPVLRTLDQIDEYVSEAASEGLAWALDRELEAE